MNNVTEKWMVVIVERHALWTLWCLDFLQRAGKEGREIEILDLSSLRLFRHKSNSKYILTRLYRKNRIENILRRVANRNKVKIIKPSVPELLRLQKKTYHTEHPSAFLNGLDSQYFIETGIRVRSLSQLKPKILFRSRKVFDRVVNLVIKIIREKEITKVVVPGGRTLIPNAVIVGTQIMETACTVLEQTTAQDTRYFEFYLDFRKDLQPLQQVIDRTWARGDHLKYEIAQNYLDNKLRGNQLGFSFSANFDSSIEVQKPKNAKLASIFVGSSFEMAPLDKDVKGTNLGSEHQKDMFRLFIKIARENGFFIVLRGHPASAGLEKIYAAEDYDWACFCDENRIVHVPSHSNLDSYKLMNTSDINVFYASTAGIDSIILGANTLILAHTDWTHLVPELCAFDEPSIRNRFRSIDRKVNPKRLYPYAYFMRRGGIEMSNVEYSSTKKALYFEGEEIGAPRLEFLEKIFKRRLK